MNIPSDHAPDSEPKVSSWVETMLMPKLRAHGNLAQGRLYVPYAEVTAVPLSYSLRLIEDEHGALLEGTARMSVPFMGEENETFQLRVETGQVQLLSKSTHEPFECDTRVLYILYAVAGLRHLLPEDTVVD